ncbi:MAG: DUF1501 domain-containing protein [Verrucomicrobia bacterium]|nr:DUF1501 domain-containing protein [Verrucomicrobiota bacterium]
MSLSLPMTRREAVRLGLFSTAGLLLADRRVLGADPPVAGAASTGAPTSQGKARCVIQVFLWGGMSHNDTWDPKPDSGRDYMGEFAKAIPTNADGMQLGELFPALARQADKFSLIRSMVHHNFGHETAAYLMQTAHAPGERLAYPSVGAVFAWFKSSSYTGIIPPYVVLTRPQGRFSEEGFLGPKFKPFATGSDPNAARFEVEGVVASGLTESRQQGRRGLLDKLDTLGVEMAASPQVAAAEQTKERAYELILGRGREVFDLTKEKPELRARYGRNTFGQDCLAARRLVEAGVPYIVINYPGGWDTHSNHFPTMRRQCPQLDQGLAALLEDLHARGLLDRTLVWCCGEFGRSPKVDWQPPWNGGRNHWGNVFTALVAGGGFRGGQVVGASDARAEEVTERPVYPVDLLGSLYALGGIETHARLPHPEGVEAHVLPSLAEGVKSAGRLAEIM